MPVLPSRWNQIHDGSRTGFVRVAVESVGTSTDAVFAKKIYLVAALD
jgi:hypothetical protein